MGKLRCPKCQRRDFGKFCRDCGTAYQPERLPEKDRWRAAFQVESLVVTILSTLTVMIAPLRMAQEWSRGSRDFSSPWKVFVSTVVVSYIVVKLIIPGYVDWIESEGGIASSATLAFQLINVFEPWFQDAYVDSALNSKEHLLRIRQLHNFVVFPFQALLTIYVLWWIFSKNKNRRLRLSLDDAEASVIYPSCAVYLHSLIGFTAGFLLENVVLIFTVTIYEILGTLFMVVMAIGRIQETSFLKVVPRASLALVIVFFLYYPVALFFDLVALHRIPLLDAL